MWILICSRALFLYRFQPSVTKNADRNPHILIGQRDLSSGRFSLKSTLDLRYPCAPHGNHTGHPTTFFCKITVRKSKYCLILKLQTGLNFWMTDNFRFFNASLHQTSKIHHHPSFEIVHFHFANFQGSIDKIPI